MSAGIGWWEAAFLGVIQGLTEFLPISSSAHLRIIGPLLPSGGDPGAAFTAITQIGTLPIAVLALADRWGRKQRPLSQLSWRDGLLMGYTREAPGPTALATACFGSSS